MSDVPRQKQEQQQSLEDRMARFLTPPPPPEDILVLSGDVVVLFIYAFCDHFVCQDMAEAIVRDEVIRGSGVQQVVLQVNDLGVPVWWNMADCSPFFQSTVDGALGQALADRLVVQYSPILQSTGVAACMLTGTWLLSGWMHRAFSFDNTLECTTEHALVKTAQAWITSSVLLLVAVQMSRVAACGCPSPSALPAALAQFKRGDLGYVLDSLSVLVVWRFLVSQVLGNTGRRS